MRVFFSFNLPEEEELFNTYRKAQVMAEALEEIDNAIFRPPRKYGFSEERLNELLKNKYVREYHELLAEKFYEIISNIE